MLQMSMVKKLTYIINMALMCTVIITMLACRYYGATYMFYHCIPTVAVYVWLFRLIHRDRLDLYVWIVYATIAVYMIAATVCLGFDAGFHMYCMSLIPLTFYMEYMAVQLHTRKINAMLMSLLLVAAYLVCTGYTMRHGPVYHVAEEFTYRCMVCNALGVFSFLIGYTSLVYKLVCSSEHRLSDLAHKDQLTGLYNRHYMIAYLDEMDEHTALRRWLAMIDIDSFKSINDTYGHNGGDYVLTELTRVMSEVCEGCVIARWGGEEFLIVAEGESQSQTVLETLRQRVEQMTFVFEGQTIPVSITIGVADYQAGQTMDHWIQSADGKLYFGKNHGKNQVVQ